MGLLAPWFLAGALAVGLPVWLHLLRKHRTTPLPFASLRFFERRIQSSIRHRRLQYLLLLALRAALIVLLAVAFANPFVKRPAAAGGAGRKLLVLAIDDSFSMRQGTRLATARQEATAALARLKAGDRGQVLAFSSSVRTMTDATDDPVALRAGIQAVQATDSRGSYVELARALRGIAKAARIPVEAHLFSDMQNSSLPGNLTELALPDGVRLVAHAVASARLPNFAVEGVKAPARVYDPRKVPVEATIAGFGTPQTTRRAALLLNGREVESHNVEVPEGGRASVEFTNLEAPYGMNRCAVRIDGGDTFADDDRFYFSIERADPRPVLFVEDGTSGRALLYFRAALEASGHAAFQLEPAGAAQTANMAPGRYAFVVLSDVGALPSTFENALRNYVRGGGSVLVALGANAAARGRVPVTGQKIGELRYFNRDGDRFENAGRLDPAHPSLKGAQRWDEVKFYAAVAVEPGAAQVAARLADDSPLLLDEHMGEGRVLVFASTLDNVANDFPLHPTFVPFVVETASYLGKVQDRPVQFPVDAFLELRESGEKGAAAEVLGPDGRRALSLDEAANARNLRLAQAGFYDVKRPDGRREVVAVNTDRRESDLAVIPPETLALWTGGGQAPVAAAGAPGETGSRPVQLWWYVLLAALALAAAESWVGNRHLQVERAAADAQIPVSKEAA